MKILTYEEALERDKYYNDNPCINKECEHNEIGWQMNCMLSYNTNYWLYDITQRCLKYKIKDRRNI